MHALGPPEKDANTTGHGLIFSSCMQNTKKVVTCKVHVINQISE